MGFSPCPNVRTIFRLVLVDVLGFKNLTLDKPALSPPFRPAYCACYTVVQNGCGSGSRDPPAVSAMTLKSHGLTSLFPFFPFDAVHLNDFTGFLSSISSLSSLFRPFVHPSATNPQPPSPLPSHLLRGPPVR